jgi:hypothetical protein
MKRTGYSMKMAVFWVVAPCSLEEVYRRFRGACCLHQQGDDGGYNLLDHRMNGNILEELYMGRIENKLAQFKQNWLNSVRYMRDQTPKTISCLLARRYAKT